MPKVKKRSYTSKQRKDAAKQTRSSILKAAKKLFQKEGFDQTTIKKLSDSACVSCPTVYALFKSKRGILKALIDEALPRDRFSELVESCMKEDFPNIKLKKTAKMARQIYEAEHEFMDLLRGASVVSLELKNFEKEREKRRYERQGEYVKQLMQKKCLAKDLSLEKARDILWTLTGRDLYRLCVIERKWSPDEYEKWLAELLIQSLLKAK